MGGRCPGHGPANAAVTGPGTASARRVRAVARPAFIADVERITGRRVETFMSTNHTTPDRACEVFLLDGPLGEQ